MSNRRNAAERKRYKRFCAIKAAIKEFESGDPIPGCDLALGAHGRDQLIAELRAERVAIVKEQGTYVKVK